MGGGVRRPGACVRSPPNWPHRARGTLPRTSFTTLPGAGLRLTPRSASSGREKERDEGIFHIPSQSGTDVAAQLIVLDRLQPSRLDPRLGASAQVGEALAQSPHVILNIQYPLGLGAYHILRQVMEATEHLDGVYILGKAATLNADIGDVMVSDVIHDEQSGNTYWLNNCFSFTRVSPFVSSRSVLDRQRAVSRLAQLSCKKSWLS